MSLILTRGDIAALMRPADYLTAAESAFRALGDGTAELPPPLAIHGEHGAFHAKGAAIHLDRPWVAVKLNGNFPGNPASGLPTIQGAILLCDGADGSLLAIMDSIEVTVRRTAAATALAARHLARPEAAVVTLCGCGAQAVAQLEALRDVLPLTGGYCVDSDPGRTAAIARQTGLTATADLAAATRASDVIVTCTTATQPFLSSDMVRPGTFIAAVGADAPHKSEVDAGLMAKSLVVVDSLDQCLAMGDLHHTIAAGAMAPEGVHAGLSELVSGTKRGRTDMEQVTVFDSTGLGVQDVTAAAMIFDRARIAGVGLTIDLAA